MASAIGEDDTAEMHEEREASRASRVCLRPEPDRVRDVEPLALTMASVGGGAPSPRGVVPV